MTPRWGAPVTALAEAGLGHAFAPHAEGAYPWVGTSCHGGWGQSGRYGCGRPERRGQGGPGHGPTAGLRLGFTCRSNAEGRSSGPCARGAGGDHGGAVIGGSPSAATGSGWQGEADDHGGTVIGDISSAATGSGWRGEADDHGVWVIDGRPQCRSRTDCVHHVREARMDGVAGPAYSRPGLILPIDTAATTATAMIHTNAPDVTILRIPCSQGVGAAGGACRCLGEQMENRPVWPVIRQARRPGPPGSSGWHPSTPGGRARATR